MAKVTMKDIAKASGWSLGTVSRVLSDTAGVNEKARIEVLEAAQKLNYQKNDFASALRQKRPEGILMIVQADGCPIYSRLAFLVESRLKAQGKKVTLLNVHHDENEAQAAREQMRLSTPGVLLFFGARRSQLRTLGRSAVPALCIGVDQSQLGYERLVSYGLFQTEIAQQATEWLFETGANSIGVILNDRYTFPELNDCFLGVQYAFYSRDQVFVSKERSTTQPSTLRGGYQGLLQLMQQRPDVDALLVGDEAQALGALRAAADLGKRVPEDLAIFALDLTDDSEFAIPRLSGIRRDLDEDAKRIVDLALQLESHDWNSLESPMVEASWQVRWKESCPKPTHPFTTSVS